MEGNAKISNIYDLELSKTIQPCLVQGQNHTHCDTHKSIPNSTPVGWWLGAIITFLGAPCNSGIRQKKSFDQDLNTTIFILLVSYICLWVWIQKILIKTAAYRHPHVTVVESPRQYYYSYETSWSTLGCCSSRLNYLYIYLHDTLSWRSEPCVCFTSSSSSSSSSSRSSSSS